MLKQEYILVMACPFYHRSWQFAYFHLLIFFNMKEEKAWQVHQLSIVHINFQAEVL